MLRGPFHRLSQLVVVKLCAMQRAAWRLSVLLLFCWSSSPVEAVQTKPKDRFNDAPVFEEKIQGILGVHCLKCHDQKKRKAQLDLSTPTGILKGGESGRAIQPGYPDKSLLYKLVSQQEMPPEDEDRLTDDEVHAIELWIAGGARFNAKTSTEAATTRELTQQDILPILTLRCTVCHGLRRKEAELDLRSKASILKGGKSGPAMVLGKPEESLIYQRIIAEEMPPREKLIGARVKEFSGHETEQLSRWIELGAPEVAVEPDVAGTGSDPLVSSEDRDFWAFQAPGPVTPPRVRQSEKVRTPIDAFVLRKLEENRLSLSPEAKPETLLRRAYLDLTGLPPDLGEEQAYRPEDDPLAYERLIDRLLASEHYGERWGRYWLDLAGYADSEGAREQDLVRPHAYRYRDYVIRSFNENNPYDRFLLEQIAGDELFNYEQATVITDEIYDNLVATGFLRMAPDPTVANVTGLVPNRLDVIADEINILSSGVMGLTVECARCHSHKFDPIPQRDYYRLMATFKGAYDENDWLEPSGLFGFQGKSPKEFRYLMEVTTDERSQWENQDRILSTEIELLGNSLEKHANALKQRHFDEHLDQVPETLRNDVRKAFETDEKQRDATQKALVEKFAETLQIDEAKLRELDERYKKRAQEVDDQIKKLEQKRRPEPAIRALWDRGEPSSTYLLRRGNHQSPGPLVGPGVISVLDRANEPFKVRKPWPGAKKTGRRLAFAKWLTDPGHPLTARVFVNRVWKHHFKHGIVKSLGNFGRSGVRPTHPELLDWLAREFIRSGWNIKALHRLIMGSNTYRQSSAVSPRLEQLDPSNDWLSRFPLKRMDAETLRDSVLFIADRLDKTPFGPPDEVEIRKDGLVTSVSSSERYRRSIYVQQRRKYLPTIFLAFDFPQMNPNCLERPDSTVVTQALYLSNNHRILQLAGSLAKRVIEEADHEPLDQIKKLFLVALNRLPTEEEEQVLLKTMNRLEEAWTEAILESETGQPTPNLKALTSVCHTIINSAQFIYVD